MARAITVKIAVLVDPKVLSKVKAAARAASQSVSSWIVGLITRELEIDWEPLALGRPPGAKNKRKKRKKKKRKDENE